VHRSNDDGNEDTAPTRAPIDCPLSRFRDLETFFGAARDDIAAARADESKKNVRKKRDDHRSPNVRIAGGARFLITSARAVASTCLKDLRTQN